MSEVRALLFLYTETPMHPGTGAGLGTVDLPIQRERVTGLPVVQASGLKGSLRSRAEAWAKGDGEREACVRVAFGPETERASEHAGALLVGDARLLLFPVRSLRGVFAWATSPGVLARFRRDLALAGLEAPPGLDTLDRPVEEGNAWVAGGSDLLLGAGQRRIVLEEFAFTARESQEVAGLGQWLAKKALPQDGAFTYWREALPRRLAVLPDDALRDLTELATEVLTRVRLGNETRTVEQGALWSEEHLPPETLLYAFLTAHPPLAGREHLPNGWKDLSPGDRAKKVMEVVKEALGQGWLQMGGDFTLGRGILAVRLLPNSGQEG